MKKLTMAIVSALLLVCMMVMTGCSIGSPAGTYKFESMSASGEGIEINLEVGEEYMGMTLTEDFIVIELREDGTCLLTMFGEGIEGTWVKEDKTILIETEEGQTPLTISGKKITLEMDGAKVVLSK